MHSVWLIARREYIERVRTRSFVITTVMIPLIMGGFIFGSLFLGAHENPDRRVVVVSQDLPLAEAVKAELERPPSAAQTTHGGALEARPPKFTVDIVQPDDNTRALLDRDLDEDRTDGYLWIAPSAGGMPFSYTPRQASDQAMRNAVLTALNRALLRRQLAQRGIAAAGPLTLPEAAATAPAAGASHRRDRTGSMVSIGILFFIMYFVIMNYGMNVARSVIEEKTSRIFEVMLATVRPEEMMAGKIFGVGAVGLTQVAIWIGAASIAGRSGFVLAGETVRPSFTGPELCYFVIYFLLGYLFYSSIAAAFGAMTNSEQELQQMNIFLMLPLIFCFVALGTMLTHPDSTIARVLALIPPFTPLLMYMRVSLGHPYVWEIALSIAMLAGCIAGLVWVTSRIYRVGVLMYGKRPGVGELMRWLKYS
jgi:ABC-2 type transport system permease protein